jgi:hypothetical protein
MNTRKALLHRMTHLYDEVESLHFEMKNDFCYRYGTQAWLEFTWGTVVDYQEAELIDTFDEIFDPIEIVIWGDWPKKQKLNQMRVLNAELVKLWQELDINHT